MKTAKLIIDGKEIEVQISDKQVEELTAPKKVTGFERADSYLYIDSEGDIGLGYDEDDVNSDCHYAVANYYTNRRLAEAAIEEFGDEIKWLTENRPKWF